MTVSDLLEEIRAPYVRVLAAAVRRQPAFVEPAYRKADGALATDGPWDLPCRADFIPRESGHHEPSTVDSETQVQFNALCFSINGTSVALSPFVWDWVTVEVDGLSLESAAQVLKAWFLRWFDEEDESNQTEEGLFEVAHFMSDPEVTEDGVRVTVDLGSAPATAVEDLIFRVSDARARVPRVG